jgi:hypothetical protein
VAAKGEASQSPRLLSLGRSAISASSASISFWILLLKTVLDSINACRASSSHGGCKRGFLKAAKKHMKRLKGLKSAYLSAQTRFLKLRARDIGLADGTLAYRWEDYNDEYDEF